MGQELVLAEKKIADAAALISPCSVLMGLVVPVVISNAARIFFQTLTAPLFFFLPTSNLLGLLVVLDVEKAVFVVGTIRSFCGSCTYKNE